MRFGVDERTASDGEILLATSADELRSLAEKVRDKHPDAIAICLLFSFADSRNEAAVADAL